MNQDWISAAPAATAVARRCVPSPSHKERHEAALSNPTAREIGVAGRRSVKQPHVCRGKSTLVPQAGRFHERRHITARPGAHTLSATLVCLRVRRSTRLSIGRTRRRRTRSGPHQRPMIFGSPSRCLGSSPTNTSSGGHELHSSDFSRRRVASDVTVAHCWCNFHPRSSLRHAPRRDSST